MCNIDKERCFNCKHRSYNIMRNETECLIPKQQKESYFSMWAKHNDENSSCPFKELEDGGEYTYWL